MSVAKRIRAARIARGWSQAQLAERMNVTRSACSQWELVRGGTIPRGHRLERLAEQLGVTVEWITTGHNPRTGVATADDAAGYRQTLTTDERALLLGYGRLDAPGRAALLQLLQSLTARKR